MWWLWSVQVGGSLQNWHTHKKRLQTSSKLNILFCFNAENSVNNNIFVIKSKICSYLPRTFQSVGDKYPTTPLVSIQCIKKCSEVRSGLRMAPMGSGWHGLWKRDWCVDRGLKLMIIGTWQSVTKSNNMYFICTFEPHFVNYKRAKQMSIIHEFCV